MCHTFKMVDKHEKHITITHFTCTVKLKDDYVYTCAGAHICVRTHKHTHTHIYTCIYLSIYMLYIERDSKREGDR